MDLRDGVPGLGSLQRVSLGSPSVTIAVLDGPVDVAHDCFEGARLTRLSTLVQDAAAAGPMSLHGTHVASLLFGQPGSTVAGVAPGCSGLIAPVFRDVQAHYLSQLDLARAIEQSIEAGANIINISGGERSPRGEADGVLARALQRCQENNVLVVAATGNDGCECVHVPAAVDSVLAVGAMGRDGEPLESSNWGEAYQTNGILALGEEVEGAVPGGGTTVLSGSSFATPIVTGVAALLMSLQLHSADRVDPAAVRQAIIESAVQCNPRDSPDCRRYIGGTLNIPGAVALISKRGNALVANHDLAQVLSRAAEVVERADGTVSETPEAAVSTVGVGASGEDALAQRGDTLVAAPPQPAVVEAPAVVPSAISPAITTSATADRGVLPAGGCNCNSNKSYVFAIGTVGFDFGTEARRDSFRQLMPRVPAGGSPPVTVPPNPYDVGQLYAYLSDPLHPSESTKLIWTLNLDLTPIYVIEAETAYADEVYRVLRDALYNESLPTTDRDYVSRVSISGVLTNRTRRLFSGQVLPVVVAQPRGLYTWNETVLVEAVRDTMQTDAADLDVEFADRTIRQFLDKIYYELRNLGQSPPDRALNFAATNAFMFGEGIREGLLSGRRLVPTRAAPGAAAPLPQPLYTLDTITVSKSAYCRVDSDCWDIRISFFNPEDERTARAVYQYTIDVSDEMPVSLAPTHIFLNSSSVVLRV